MKRIPAAIMSISVLAFSMCSISAFAENETVSPEPGIIAEDTTQAVIDTEPLTDDEPQTEPLTFEPATEAPTAAATTQAATEEATTTEQPEPEVYQTDPPRATAQVQDLTTARTEPPTTSSTVSKTTEKNDSDNPQATPQYMKLLIPIMIMIVIVLLAALIVIIIWIKRRNKALGESSENDGEEGVYDDDGNFYPGYYDENGTFIETSDGYYDPDGNFIKYDEQ